MFIETYYQEDSGPILGGHNGGSAPQLMQELVEASVNVIVTIYRAAKLKLPSIYEFREGPEHGGLMSYGSDLAELFSRAATFMDKYSRVQNRVIYQSSNRLS